MLVRSLRRKRLITLSRVGGWMLNLLLIIIGLLILTPFLWAFTNALLPQQEALTLPPKWLPTHITWDNFAQVFGLIPFGVMVFNSFKIAFLTTFGALIVSTLAAYALSRLDFPGRNAVFILLLSAMMVPTQVTAIPTFILIRTLGLLDTHEAVYLPALINVFGIFFLRQSFLTIPRELEDAARLDGAGYLRRLWTVILPLSRSALASLAIFIFLTSWNDFFWPNLFLSSPEKMTLPVGLVSLRNPYGSGAPPSVIFAAISLVLVPVLILFSFTQRSITESIARTGLRG